jgi:alpha,alpha-trehalase
VTTPSGPVAIALDRERFDAVVFDLDGVMTDTARLHYAAWKEMFDDYLRVRSGPVDATRPFDEDDYRRYVDGKPRDDGVESFLASRDIELPRGSLGDPPERETVWGLANRKNEQFKRAVTEMGVVAYPSSVALVHALQARRIGTAIVSASRNCRTILSAAGIGDLFEVRVDGLVAEQLQLPGKPAPAMFLEAARRLGAEAARSVVVEDALAGVEAGRRGEFGLVIGVDRVGQGEALRRHGADVVVRDLAAVSVR